MLLRSEFTLSKPTSPALAKLEVPIELALEGDRVATIADFDDKSWQLAITGPIDPDGLELITETKMTRTTADGTEETVPAVYVHDPAAAQTSVLARSLASALSFLLDRTVRLSVRPDVGGLIPETPADRELVDAWGTTMRITEFDISIMGGSQSGRISAAEIEGVLPQQAGLRLYEESLRVDTATAKFRDLWRVLESAFGKTDSELTGLLADFEPLKEMGVDAVELKALLVLRGRASHAKSRVGLSEITAVESLCHEQLGRLKNLAERVIETKKSWGYSTLAHLERLEPGRRLSLTKRHVRSGETLTIGR